MAEQSYTFAELDWEQGNTPRSRRFDDPFFAREDGRAETRHVFLAGNGLPGRWHDRSAFTIAELGFGTGLNFLETCALWHRDRGRCNRLLYIAFELYPLASGDIERALSPWPDLAPQLTELLAQWPPPAGRAIHDIALADDVTVRIHIGDANHTLAAAPPLAADAWYLDGFSPAKNPDLWGAELMQAVFEHTAPGGTFATYTAAGFVRRNLTAAGFEVTRIAGYGRKRESLAGRRP